MDDILLRHVRCMWHRPVTSGDAQLTYEIQAAELAQTLDDLGKTFKYVLDGFCRDNVHCDFDLAELDAWPDMLKPATPKSLLK